MSARQNQYQSDRTRAHVLYASRVESHRIALLHTEILETSTMMNGSENDESAMSPLVTAQDRKRKILERRRKEREQQHAENEKSNSSLASLQQMKRRKSDPFSVTTRLFHDEDATPKATKNTLFGAVMQRTSSASTPTKSALGSNSNDNASSLAATPLQNNNSRVSWNDVTTPSSSRSKSFLSANSPCGFALLKVLESVASPFRHKDDDVDASDEKESPEERIIEEWQEGFLRQDTIGVVDWSIKRKLRLECHPGSCLPRTLDWQEALSYWQHPAMYPLPNFDENASSELVMSQSTREVSASMHPSSSLCLSGMVRGRDALLHRLARQDPRLWKQRRNREWQEAFRSLYFKWMQQVEALQQVWENGCDVSPQVVARTYFYAMAPGQTVLFRVGMTEPCNSSDKETSETEKPRILPMVVLSSTSHSLRSKLRSMGAKLVYYHDRNVEFEEAVLERRKPEKVAQDETEEVNQELEALRRAQAHGATAGADVSISTKTKAAQKSPRSLPPLCLLGEDDCIAFFEYYVNTLGRSSNWFKGNGDVPLLLSRKVGHFVHASLQSLAVTSRREANDPHDKSNDHHHAAIQLCGTILPCAMEDLLCTAASRMVQDNTENVQPCKGHDDDIGSHYFVVQAQIHDGEERPNVDSSTTGTAGSRWFNDGVDLCSTIAAIENGPNDCEHGEVVSMVVWDVARPDMIAYKTEPSYRKK